MGRLDPQNGQKSTTGVLEKCRALSRKKALETTCLRSRSDLGGLYGLLEICPASVRVGSGSQEPRPPSPTFVATKPRFLGWPPFHGRFHDKEGVLVMGSLDSSLYVWLPTLSGSKIQPQSEVLSGFCAKPHPASPTAKHHKASMSELQEMKGLLNFSTEVRLTV